MFLSKVLFILGVAFTLLGELTLNCDTSSLSKLVELPENREIFSQLLYSDNAFYDEKKNILGTLDFVESHLYQRQPYVANGYFGARIPNLGHGFANDTLSSLPQANNEDLSNGWPLFNERYAGAFAAGFYDLQKSTNGSNFPWLNQYGWDSVISAIPQWTFLGLAMGDKALDPSSSPATWGSISNYTQNLSMETGVVSTQYTWLNKVNVRYDVSANKKDVNLGLVKVTIENPTDTPVTITVTDRLDFETSRRCNLRNIKQTDKGLLMSFSPSGLSDVFGAVYSELSFQGEEVVSGKSGEDGDSIERSVTFSISPEKFITVSKLVAVVTTDLDVSSFKLEDDVILAALKFVESSNYEALLESNRKGWSKSLLNSLFVTFPDSRLLTLASRASIYHLNANMREGAEGLTSALGVSGLSSDSYAGQVFWDTDLWMLIGIMPFNPEVSKSLLHYRLETRNQAKNNIQSPLRPKDTFKGAIYPWTSGRFGNCTATGPCFDYEYHISSAVALSAFKLYLSGSVDDAFLEEKIFPIIYDAATLFSSYVEYNETLAKYVTRNLTDPDEFANHVNNAAYTNSAISATMSWIEAVSRHLGKTIPEEFLQIKGNMHIPVSTANSNIVLEYSGMDSNIRVKQADVIMITYPLENELILPEQAVANLEYYAMKQVSTGPAMTYPIFSIVSSALSDQGCSSESYLMKSVQPFLRGPFAQFSEQNNDNFLTNQETHPAFPFLTAHGGFLQLIILGVLGVRYTFEIEESLIVRYLEFDAKKLSLFPQGLSVKGLKYLNHTLDITLNLSEFIIENHGLVDGLNSNIDEFKVVFKRKNDEKDTKKLSKNSKVSFDVRLLKKANPQSLTECGLARFGNISSGAFGDVVDLMHDGDNNTYWQAAYRDKARIFIDLMLEHDLSKGYINWGNKPPQELRIFVEDDFTEDNSLQIHEGYVSNISDIDQPEINTLKDLKWANEQIIKFKQVSAEAVTASEAEENDSSVRLQKTHNVTSFDFPPLTKSRFVLVEFEGTHDDSQSGAKVYDVSFM